MIKYVVFDFDGTLADSKEVVIGVYNDIAEKHGFRKVSAEEAGLLRPLSIKERCRILNVPIYKLPLLAGDFLYRYHNQLNNIRLYPEIEKLVEDLRGEGFEVGVISSNSEKNIREFLSRNLRSGVEDVFCSSNLFGKDRVIKRFLKRHQLKTSEIIYVGDEQRDVIACKKTSVNMIWVSWGYDPYQLVQSENPRFIAHTPADILKTLQELKAGKLPMS
ncbi:HAD-IA family hydrolase [Pedobacter sp. SYSU D00535]|uniref:HAD-IA family hydrolase n=1 Tax=Pedobacter sp. SYSU D00535 TaxID=2810308 RepID=UPI001A96B986|nr:HAD-IA family hydrolase [Pedobacter sp. SYSU D00535]